LGWAYLDGRWISDKILNFVNHSCNPNSRIDLESLELIAIRDIGEDEEITLDYDLTEHGTRKIICNCKESRCRK
jgi:uncharacterized protein